MRHGHARDDDNMTKSRNRKFILVTSSNECREQNGVDLSDYNGYLNQIWYRAKAPHYQHYGMPKFTYVENPRWRRPPSWISKNVNNSGLNKGICTKFGGKMHHGHAELTTWPKVETGSSFAWRHQMNIGSVDLSDYNRYWTRFSLELKHHTIDMMECFGGIVKPWCGTRQSMHLRNLKSVASYQKQSRDPDHVPFRGNFSSVGWNLPSSTHLPNLNSVASSTAEILKEFKICRQWQTDTAHHAQFPTSKHYSHAHFVAWQVIINKTYFKINMATLLLQHLANRDFVKARSSRDGDVVLFVCPSVKYGINWRRDGSGFLCRLRLSCAALLTDVNLLESMPRRIIRRWYTGRWLVGCYIWYSEEGTGRGRSPPSPLLAVPNVTAPPCTNNSTAV